MKLDMEIDYIIALMSAVRMDSIRHLKAKKNNNAESDDIYSYHSKLLSLLPDFKGSLADLKAVHRECDNTSLPEEYSALVVGYFKLLEDMFTLLALFNHGLSLNLVSDILGHVNDIKQAAHEIIKGRFLNSNVEKELFPDLLNSKLRLEGEKRLSLSGSVRVGIEKKIDNEMDRIRLDIKKDLNDVDNKYSEGRRDIINTFNQYEESVTSLLNDARESLEKYKIDGDSILSDIYDKKSAIEVLTSSIETQLNLAEGILKDTSQLGMAAAFKERHLALRIPMWFWIISFFSCLGLLTNVSIMFVEFVFTANSEVKSTAEVISRLAITLPFIWGAWFSAKQYNHISQLREDYAYKVAVAMTYHGYKDEAQKSNSQMNEKLLESIVAQFSENPVRLYRNDNSASLFESLLKNNKISDVISAIKGGK